MNRFDHHGGTQPGTGSRPARRSRTGEPVAPRRRIRAAGSSPRAGASRRAPTPTPATVWTVDPTPGGASGAWPLTVVQRVVSAFSEPGDRVLLLTPAPPDPAAPDAELTAALEAVCRADRLGATAEQPAMHPTGPTSAPRPPLPYWADVFHTEHPATLTAEADPADPTADDRGDHLRLGTEPAVADLVIASVGPDSPLDAHFGLVCAARLRTGGILAVLTHSDWTRGRLVGPTGPIVAAAQNADLLYLQHIVVVHAAVRDGAFVLDSDSPLAEDEQRGRHRAAARGLPAPHRRIHTDLLVFAKPRDHDPSPTSPASAAFETGVIR
jgi:hypothetical protein